MGKSKGNKYPLKEVAKCLICGNHLTSRSSNGTRYYRCATYANNKSCVKDTYNADKLEYHIENVLFEKINKVTENYCFFSCNNIWLNSINYSYKNRYDLDQSSPDFEKYFEIYTNGIKEYAENLIKIQESLLKDKSLWYKKEEDCKQYTLEEMLIFVENITVNLKTKSFDMAIKIPDKEGHNNIINFGFLGEHENMSK